MYSWMILVAMSAGEAAPFHHFPFNPYAQQTLHGPPCCPGGWGLPYCGYYPWHGWENGHPPGPEGPLHGPHLGFGPGLPPGEFGHYLRRPVENGRGREKEPEPEKKEKGDNKEKKEPDDSDDPKKEKNDKKKSKEDDGKEPKLDDLEQGRLQIRLPEGASLFVNGQLIQAASDGETFRTPKLVKGKEYFYEVRVEVVQEAKKVTLTRRVRVMAGKESRADFTELRRDTGVAQSSK